ncbi:accessory gene regulator ArgB-like protein [Caminicella sporogenes]|uniref:accessory gene regulator ArgB-like protein n=1 Tax=Caminicella sporogenes TaxID=166485 RepID=UPI003A7F4FED
MKKKFDVETFITHILKIFKKHLEIDKKQDAILRYSLRLLISSILAYAFALLPALFFGTFKHVLITMLTFSTLRVFSGGAHCSCMLNCIASGAVFANILGLITKNIILNINKSIILTIITFTFLYSLWSIGKFAPADTPGKPITTKAKKQKLKKMSLIVLCIWCFLCLICFILFDKYIIFILASTFGILWQSFTLTNTGYKFYNIFDKILHIFFKEGDFPC